MSIVQAFIGPRIPVVELQKHWIRYATPTALLSLARICLLCSLFLPYWHMKLEAPQYPKGLFLNAYVNHTEGNVREINALNHYIGMKPLDEAAKFEKATAVWAIIAMVLLVEAATFVHSKWAVLFVLPAIAFPAVFLIDLRYWMALFGQNLDPHAPLSSSVKPFTPPTLGEGVIGQFKTIAWMGWGLYLAFAGAVIALLSLVFHRFAYKPLFESAKSNPLA